MAKRLKNMTVRVTSPDSQLVGVYGAEHGASVEFLNGSYRHYTERGLERQLSQVATGLWMGYERAYDAALTEAAGEPMEKAKEIADAP